MKLKKELFFWKGEEGHLPYVDQTRLELVERDKFVASAEVASRSSIYFFLFSTPETYGQARPAKRDDSIASKFSKFMDAMHQHAQSTIPALFPCCLTEQGVCKYHARESPRSTDTRHWRVFECWCKSNQVRVEWDPPSLEDNVTRTPTKIVLIASGQSSHAPSSAPATIVTSTQPPANAAPVAVAPTTDPNADLRARNARLKLEVEEKELLLEEKELLLKLQYLDARLQCE